MLGVAGLLAVASICLLGALCLRHRTSLELAVSGLCGVIAHAGMLLTALGGVGIPRYTLGLWVPLAVGTAFSALWVARLAQTPGLISTAANTAAASPSA
jgi:hypothetical protein